MSNQGQSHATRRVTLGATLRFACHQWRGQGRLVALILTLGLAAAAASVLMPLAAGRLVDTLAAAGDAPADADLDAAIRATALFLALAAVALVTRHGTWFGIIRLTLAAMSRAIRDGFERVQNRGLDWHASHFGGSTVRAVTRGTWAIDLFNDTVLVELIPLLVVMAGTTALLAVHMPLVGLVTGLGVLLYVVVVALVSVKLVSPISRLANLWDSRLGGALADSIGGNLVVKLFGAERRERARLDRVANKWRERTHRAWMRGTAFGFFQSLVLLLLQAITLAVALWLWRTGAASVGDLAFVITAFLVLQGYLRNVGMNVRDLQKALNEMEELAQLMSERPEDLDRPGARPLVVEAGAIAFDGLLFRHENAAAPLFQDFDLVIPPGQRVGLVGRSGSGKSTLTRLLLGLHPLQDGRILIDGQDIAAATRASLRRQIAVVPQDPILFHRSLAENIGYGRPGATQAEIEAAARAANAHAFIVDLPRGYDTPVGERGVKLSGGERQRIAIARAMLADAPILLLDEATSSLDSESEGLVQAALERLMEGRTTLVIAHRLSTLRRMDRIVVLDRGRIVEDGGHDRLLASDDGLYRDLFIRQFGEPAAAVME